MIAIIVIGIFIEGLISFWINMDLISWPHLVLLDTVDITSDTTALCQIDSSIIKENVTGHILTEEDIVEPMIMIFTDFDDFQIY